MILENLENILKLIIFYHNRLIDLDKNDGIEIK